MWSAERYRAPAALLLGVALVVGACQVRPLYGPTPQGSTVQAELSEISIAPAAGRLGQIVRNELIFLFNGGGQPGAAYNMTLNTTASGSNVVVRKIGGEPQGRFINVRTVYQLFRQGEKKPILAGAVTRQATYEWTNQRFANDRAQLDAQERAAKEVAEEIRLQLSAFFATGGRTSAGSSPELIREEDENALPGITDSALESPVIPGTDGGTGTGLLD